MELSELTAYAEEKFNIREQHKWDDFPGFSVLADPNTGKWVALLMRQWDTETGTEIQRCDIKCGADALDEFREPYLGAPYRMKGTKWVGVRFDGSTDPDTVCRLFDRAVYAGERRGYTIVLGEMPERGTGAYRNTVLPGFKAAPAPEDESVPPKIREMLSLYEYRGGSIAGKAENFCRQGRFMADYEDDAPWPAQFTRYFPTYHDLNVRQLRGYFAWRTLVRRGEYRAAPASLAYIYIYELLNGIGASSPDDALEKMQEFKTGFLDSGVGDRGMYRNLNRWMLEFAVINDLPVETARKYADAEMLKKDAALAALSAPGERTDAELFSALNEFAEKKPGLSPVAQKFPEKAERLFAKAWRSASESYNEDGTGIFAACFGERQPYPWHPLGNAVYFAERPHPDADYVLDECRAFRCRGGVWTAERYDSLHFHPDRFNALLHETDRAFRRHLKTGHYLRSRPGEAWAAQFAEAAIEEERRAEEEAARPKITLDLTSLERIRRDASATRESLLSEEETRDGPDSEPEAFTNGPEPAGEAFNAPGMSTAPEGKAAALDLTQRRILLALARGEDVDGYIKAEHLMPSVVADAINEALYDEFGDSVLECDGDSIAAVDDYREDILRMFGGNSL